jgi:S-methylmethionine-dependent homocysteine/selenocysteine methylase
MEHVELLDGAIGTELIRRGHDLRGPAWSSGAILRHPEAIASLHTAYAQAGATIHTTATFRVRHLPDWPSHAERAAAITRTSIPVRHRVAGSMSPTADCYQPWRWERAMGWKHHALAEALAPHVDILLCETFANPDEATHATRAANATGVEVWTALTAGPSADLLGPAALVAAASECLRNGATRVLLNCTAASESMAFVRALRGLPFGVYANAGPASEGLGFCEDPDVLTYARLAREWAEAGAQILGGCCGTGPAHIAAIRSALESP